MSSSGHRAQIFVSFGSLLSLLPVAPRAQRPAPFRLVHNRCLVGNLLSECSARITDVGFRWRVSKHAPRDPQPSNLWVLNTLESVGAALAERSGSRPSLNTYFTQTPRWGASVMTAAMEGLVEKIEISYQSFPGGRS